MRVCVCVCVRVCRGMTCLDMSLRVYVVSRHVFARVRVSAVVYTVEARCETASAPRGLQPRVHLAAGLWDRVSMGARGSEHPRSWCGRRWFVFAAAAHPSGSSQFPIAAGHTGVDFRWRRRAAKWFGGGAADASELRPLPASSAPVAAAASTPMARAAPAWSRRRDPADACRCRLSQPLPCRRPFPSSSP